MQISVDSILFSETRGGKGRKKYAKSGGEVKMGRGRGMSSGYTMLRWRKERGRR